MSGSGGYYKYRCKYFYTHNCPYWVWVHNAPCAHCLADGRDINETITPSPFRLSPQVYVPRFENGALHYTIMEIVATSDSDSGWAVKAQLSQTFPTATGPSAASSIVAESSKNILGMQASVPDWSIRGPNFQ